MISPSSGITSRSDFAIALSGCSAQHASGESFADALAAVAAKNDAASGEDALDTITLSGASPLLSKVPLILPTMENVRKLSAALGKELGSFFRENGISGEPPAEFVMDGAGQLTVKGDRSDRERIAELVNADPELARRIRTLITISSHAYSLPEHLRFQAEYRASDNPEAVVAKYNHLFGRRESHAFSVRFDGERADVLSDGKVWIRPETTEANLQTVYSNLFPLSASTPPSPSPPSPSFSPSSDTIPGRMFPPR